MFKRKFTALCHVCVNTENGLLKLDTKNVTNKCWIDGQEAIRVLANNNQKRLCHVCRRETRILYLLKKDNEEVFNLYIKTASR